MASVRRKCKMEDFGEELGIIIKAYEADLNDELKKDIRDCGKLALEEVKKPPPGAGKYHDWGDYSSGWHYRTEEKFGIYSIRIRNTKKPGLTHLLELGHVVHTNDPETDGKTWSKKFPHIAKAAAKASQELTRRIHGQK